MKNIYIIKDTKNNLVFNEEFNLFSVKFATQYTNKEVAKEKMEYAKLFGLEDAKMEVIKIN